MPVRNLKDLGDWCLPFAGVSLVRGRVIPPKSLIFESRDDRPAWFRAFIVWLLRNRLPRRPTARAVLGSVGPLDAEIDDLDELALDR